MNVVLTVLNEFYFDIIRNFLLTRRVSVSDFGAPPELELSHRTVGALS